MSLRWRGPHQRQIGTIAEKVLTNFSVRNIGVPNRETAPRGLYLSAADAKRGLIRFEHGPGGTLG